MRKHEQPQPLLITRQPNDRRGCRLLPVPREVKQAWLNAAYSGIESLKDTGTRDDLVRLRDIYTCKKSWGRYTFPKAPAFLREDLEKHWNYSQGRAEGNGHSVITGTIVALEVRFPEDRSRPLIITRMSEKVIRKFLDGEDWRATMLRRDERVHAMYSGIESLKTIGTRDDFVRLKEIYTERVEVIERERLEETTEIVIRDHYYPIELPVWRSYTQRVEVHEFPNAPEYLGLNYNDPEEVQDARVRNHLVFRETIEVLEKRFPDTDIPQQQ